jgi:Major intrinsic protein
MASLAQRIASEFLGTALLLAAVVGSGIMAKLADGNNALALLCNTIPTGAMLVVLILIFGPLSGAHFNPAVSLAFALRGALPWTIAGIYILAQVVGGIVGIWVAHTMFQLPGVATIDDRAEWFRPMARGSCTYLWSSADDIWLCRPAVRSDGLCRRSLHHGSVLVYFLDIIRQPRRDNRAITL